MLGGIFSIDVGDFTCLPGEREKWCPGGRLPLNAGELEALLKTDHSNDLPKYSTTRQVAVTKRKAIIT